MRNYTIVYHSKRNKGLKAFHVQDVTTEKLQKAFDEAEISMIEHIIEQYVTIGVNKFRPIVSEEAILAFLKEWSIDY